MLYYFELGLGTVDHIQGNGKQEMLIVNTKM